MKKIWIGLLFLFLNFTLDFGVVKIGLFPTFVGYILIVLGLSEMAPESAHFGRMKSFSVIMAVYTGMLYLFDLVGITSQITLTIVLIISAVAALISYYISYHIVAGVGEMEQRYGYHLGAGTLKNSWIVLVIFNALSYLSAFQTLVGVLLTIASFVAGICFICFFGHSKNCYTSMKESQRGASGRSDRQDGSNN